MLKHTLAAAALAGLAFAPAQAVTLTQWTFNSAVADATATTGTLAPAVGAGTASLVGGATSSGFNSGDANGGSTDPNVGDDSGWQITSYTAQGQGDKTRGVQFLVDTTGFTSVVVSWDQRQSNTSSRFSQFQYTTDGSNFIDAVLFTGATGDTWFNNRQVDLSGMAGVANNPNFGFRIVSTFAPGTSGYQASNAANVYSSAGTNRFDMVTVNVTPVPEPQTYALMLAGLAAVGAIVRRRGN